MCAALTSSSTSAPAATRLRDHPLEHGHAPAAEPLVENADCGLTTETWGATASTTVRANRSEPGDVVVETPPCRRAACGSIPTQKGPALSDRGGAGGRRRWSGAVCPGERAGWK